jgi:hypothetical protein
MLDLETYAPQFIPSPGPTSSQEPLAFFFWHLVRPDTEVSEFCWWC